MKLAEAGHCASVPDTLCTSWLINDRSEIYPIALSLCPKWSKELSVSKSLFTFLTPLYLPPVWISKISCYRNTCYWPTHLRVWDLRSKRQVTLLALFDVRAAFDIWITLFSYRVRRTLLASRESRSVGSALFLRPLTGWHLRVYAFSLVPYTLWSPAGICLSTASDASFYKYTAGLSRILSENGLPLISMLRTPRPTLMARLLQQRLPIVDQIVHASEALAAWMSSNCLRMHSDQIQYNWLSDQIQISNTDLPVL